jgi:hypothetical protein
MNPATGRMRSLNPSLELLGFRLCFAKLDSLQEK